MTGFLHRHHESEDERLYPLVRSRDPAAAELLDSIDADHQRIAPPIAGLTEAALAYATALPAGEGAARAGLAQALDQLADVFGKSNGAGAGRIPRATSPASNRPRTMSRPESRRHRGRPICRYG